MDEPEVADLSMDFYQEALKARDASLGQATQLLESAWSVLSRYPTAHFAVEGCTCQRCWWWFGVARPVLKIIENFLYPQRWIVPDPRGNVDRVVDNIRFASLLSTESDVALPDGEVPF